MMLERYSAFVLLLSLLATAASAQDGCKEAGMQLQSSWQQLQSAQSDISAAEIEYSTCVQDQGRENCEGMYSKLKYARDALKTAVSEYESDRNSTIESGCVEPSDEGRRPFGKTRPLGVWPPPK